MDFSKLNLKRAKMEKSHEFLNVKFKLWGVGGKDEPIMERAAIEP